MQETQHIQPLPIRILSPDVINQIAAGEILERPANLIKELLENSLDAGATEIEVDWSDGGRIVRIRDNGHGFSESTATLAFEKHSTSKISNAGDLFRLSTFGFRGEALSSIAAVSEMTLCSFDQKNQKGFKVSAHFGQIHAPTSYSITSGTEIKVSQLFENVPARKKFLKSDAAESTQIKKVLKAFALSHPSLTFKIFERGRMTSLWTATSNWKERCQQVLEIQSSLFEFSFGQKAIATHLPGITGQIVLSSPQTVFQSSNHIWIFVQNRWVLDKTIQAAVMEGYRGQLMHGEYPLVIVRLNFDPSEVDVNVHPTKSQVKFQNSSQVFRAVSSEIRNFLAEHVGPSQTIGRSPMLVQEDSPSLKFLDQHFQETRVKETSFPSFLQRTEKNQTAELPIELTTHQQFSHISLGFWSKLDVLGQADHTYIIAQSDQDLLLIDQHAAHERVLFEKLHKQLQSQVSIQSFLVPPILFLEPYEATTLMSFQSDLLKIGLRIEQVSPQQIALTEAPAIFKTESLLKAFDQLRSKLDVTQAPTTIFESLRQDLIATMACHSAIRAGQTLSLPHMKQLLAEMDECPLSSFCPHGRPVSVKWTFSQLEKEFGRKL